MVHGNLLYSDVVSTSFAAAKELLQLAEVSPHKGDVLLQLALAHVLPLKGAVG